MTVAELKARIIPGTRLTRISDSAAGGPRVVSRVTEQGFHLTGMTGSASWEVRCAWPKSDSKLEATETGFKIHFPGAIGYVSYAWGHDIPEVATHAEF